MVICPEAINLYRIPQEALITGASPAVIRESRSSSHLRQISSDPFVTIMEARPRTAWPRLPQRGARGASEGRGGLRSNWPVAKGVYSLAILGASFALDLSLVQIQNPHASRMHKKYVQRSVIEDHFFGRHI